MKFLEKTLSYSECLGLGDVDRNFHYTGFTTMTSAVFLPTVWSREVVRATENALVAAGLVKRYDYLVQGRGQTIDIPNISNAFTARSKTQGSDVTDDNVTETQTQITINNWYYNSFIIEDIVSVQSIYDLRSEYSNKAGYSIAKKVDTDIMGTYSSWTNTAVGTYGVDIGDSTIVSAYESLNLADMPLEDRAIIVHPKQISAIMKLDKFVKADFQGEYQKPTQVKTSKPKKNVARASRTSERKNTPNSLIKLQLADPIDRKSVV